MSFAVGSLVKARGREWVVQPKSDDTLLYLRPLVGADEEATAIYLPLGESVAPAEFALPSASDLGSFQSCKMLRDAVRLGFRSSAGPFRSFAQISFEPRPYQLVPLLMALRLDPVRMLIADDVGVGKTIEACLALREMVDRGEVSDFAVLCPPHLAEQWQQELRDKFLLDAELVLSSTAKRLERGCGANESLFAHHRRTVVSLDYIKTEAKRDEFLRECPDFVIVDEAHTCSSAEGRKSEMQRFNLVNELSRKKCHLLLVTATPHSGKEEAFRSLLTMLNSEFADLPASLGGEENRKRRESIARHVVQRRRGDIRKYMEIDTPFPDRKEPEATYQLSKEYMLLFEKVLAYAREVVDLDEEKTPQRRIRWWSALALLRCMASSPAAAAATLRTRARNADSESAEEADQVGQSAVMDANDEDMDGVEDMVPGSDFDEADGDPASPRARLLKMAREAEDLRGRKDNKLTQAKIILEKMLKDGFNPIVFCRYIPTAEYLADELRDCLKNVEIACVTGLLPPAEREERIAQLAEAPRRILVCTDCLSEGINLQEHFDAVVHYDLSWNPTRHEQREGRVDRFGQPKPLVRALTLYGSDNGIDGVVLDTLLRKHRTISKSLGVSVPVPMNYDNVLVRILEKSVLKKKKDAVSHEQQVLFEIGQEDADLNRLHIDWERSCEQEKQSRTVFAQAGIKVEEVAPEFREAQEKIGLGVDLESFVILALKQMGAAVTGRGPYDLDLKECPPQIIPDDNHSKKMRVQFTPSPPEGVVCLTRTHPFVEGVARYVFDTALDPQSEGIAKRAGAIRTNKVAKRTTLLLVRFRFQILSRSRSQERALLAEDCQVLGFEGSPANAVWLTKERVDEVLKAKATANLQPGEGEAFVQRALDGFDLLQPHLNEAANEMAEELLASHQRVRVASRNTAFQQHVEPKTPPDVLGIYIYLPDQEN